MDMQSSSFSLEDNVMFLSYGLLQVLHLKVYGKIYYV